MALPEPRFSGPIEARTLPGRVWPWILALPVGRAVPGSRGGFGSLTNQSCQAGTEQSLCSGSGSTGRHRGGSAWRTKRPVQVSCPPRTLPTAGRDISQHNLKHSTTRSCTALCPPPPLFGLKLFSLGFCEATLSWFFSNLISCCFSASLLPPPPPLPL